MLPCLPEPGSRRAGLLVVRQPARPYAASQRAVAARPRRARHHPVRNYREANLPELSRRSRQRLLAAAAARVERAQGYRRSLGALQRLVAAFREELNEAQRARWLEVEEALLEHMAQGNEAYFWEGARVRLAAGVRRERAAIAALAEIVARLARRR